MKNMLIYHIFEENYTCSKVFVKCIICFGEFEKFVYLFILQLKKK